MSSSKKPRPISSGSRRYESGGGPGSLVLDTGEKSDLTDIWSAEVTVPSPSRNLELVLGVAGGTVLLAGLIYLVASEIVLSHLFR